MSKKHRKQKQKKQSQKLNQQTQQFEKQNQKLDHKDQKAEHQSQALIADKHDQQKVGSFGKQLLEAFRQQEAEDAASTDEDVLVVEEVGKTEVVEATETEETQVRDEVVTPVSDDLKAVAENLAEDSGDSKDSVLTPEETSPEATDEIGANAQNEDPNDSLEHEFDKLLDGNTDEISVNAQNEDLNDYLDHEFEKLLDQNIDDLLEYKTEESDADAQPHFAPSGPSDQLQHETQKQQELAQSNQTSTIEQSPLTTNSLKESKDQNDSDNQQTAEDEETIGFYTEESPEKAPAEIEIVIGGKTYIAVPKDEFIAGQTHAQSSTQGSNPGTNPGTNPGPNPGTNPKAAPINYNEPPADLSAGVGNNFWERQQEANLGTSVHPQVQAQAQPQAYQNQQGQQQGYQNQQGQAWNHQAQQQWNQQPQQSQPLAQSVQQAQQQPAQQTAYSQHKSTQFAPYENQYGQVRQPYTDGQAYYNGSYSQQSQYTQTGQQSGSTSQSHTVHQQAQAYVTHQQAHQQAHQSAQSQVYNQQLQQTAQYQNQQQPQSYVAGQQYGHSQQTYGGSYGQSQQVQQQRGQQQHPQQLNPQQNQPQNWHQPQGSQQYGEPSYQAYAQQAVQPITVLSTDQTTVQPIQQAVDNHTTQPSQVQQTSAPLAPQDVVQPVAQAVAQPAITPEVHHADQSAVQSSAPVTSESATQAPQSQVPPPADPPTVTQTEPVVTQAGATVAETTGAHSSESAVKSTAESTQVDEQTDQSSSASKTNTDTPDTFASPFTLAWPPKAPTSSAQVTEVTETEKDSDAAKASDSFSNQQTATSAQAASSANQATTRVAKASLGTNYLDQDLLAQIQLLQVSEEPTYNIDTSEPFWQRLAKFYRELGQLIRTSPKLPIGKQALPITREELHQGRIERQEVIDYFWLSEWEKRVRQKNGAVTIDEVKQNASKQVLITTAVLVTGDVQGNVSSAESLIYFPFIIYEDGRILPDKDFKATTPAAFVSYSLKHAFTEASLLKQKSETASNDRKAEANLDNLNFPDSLKYLYYVHRQGTNILRNAIARSLFADVDPNKALVKDELYIQENQLVNTGESIEHLLSKALPQHHDDRADSLFRLLPQDPEKEDCTSLDDPEQQIKLLKTHVGHFSRQHPLAHSQRRALSSLAKDAEAGHPFSSISGPPGTGKTTIISAMVAQKLVQYALEKEDAPVICISSTNNQPLQNILETFQVVKTHPGDSDESQHLDQLQQASQRPNLRYGAYVEQHQGQNLRNLELPLDERFLPDIEIERKGKGVEDTVFKVCDGLSAERRPLNDFGIYITRDEKVNKRFKSEAAAYPNLTDIFASSSYRDYAKLYFLEQLNHVRSRNPQLNEDTSSLDKPLTSLLDAKAWLHKKLVATKEYLPSGATFLQSWFYYLKGLESYSQELLQKVKTNVGFSVINHLLDLYPRVVKDYLKESNSSSDPSKVLDFIELQVSKELKAQNQQRQATGIPAYTDAEFMKNLVLNFFTRLLDLLNSLFDITFRADMFWLAAHYYEAEWLLKGQSRRANGQLRKCFNLFPIHAGTVFSLTPLFANKETFRLKYDADLLIVDESSQVPVHLGVPLVDIAKQVVVIGDSKQLSPVIGFSPDFEMGLVGKYFARDEINTLDEHRLANYFNGTLMTATQKLSRWRHGDTEGVVLEEHYRCYPEIINFCSKLSYSGKLKAMRTSAFLDRNNPQRLELPLDYVYVNSESSRVGTSRTNAREADAICLWVRNNYQRLREAFRNKEGDLGAIKNILAIISPFREQAYLIQQKLRQTFREMNIPGHKNPEKLVDSMVISTVHAIQGAERPIILFSTVYGENDEDAQFIKENVEIINVAVSRAKNQFVMFGSKKHLDGDLSVFREYKKAFDEQLTKIPPEHEIRTILQQRGIQVPEFSGTLPEDYYTTQAQQQMPQMQLWLEQWQAENQQAGNYQASQGYPQQGNYSQQASYGQQTGFGPQAGYGQQAGYNQHTGYNQQNNYPAHGGYAHQGTAPHAGQHGSNYQQGNYSNSYQGNGYQSNGYPGPTGNGWTGNGQSGNGWR